MAAMTDFLENKYIDWYFRGQAFGVNGASAGAGSGPTALWVALMTTVDNDGQSAKVEVTGGSYARVQITSSMANWAGTQGAGTTTASTGSSGTTSNNNVVTFPTPTGDWGRVTGYEIYDAATGGNGQYYTTLTNAKNINNGDPAPTFPAGTLQVQVDN
jgi:hypothetical protein